MADDRANALSPDSNERIHLKALVGDLVRKNTTTDAEIAPILDAERAKNLSISKSALDGPVQFPGADFELEDGRPE